MKKLQITVVSAKNLLSTKKIRVTISLLDREGTKIGEDSKTPTIKGADPAWDYTVRLNVTDQFAGVAIRVWERKFFGGAKQIGIVTVKFNTEMANDASILDQWLPLASKDKKKQAGEIFIKAKFVGNKKTEVALTEEKDKSSDEKLENEEEKSTDKTLKVSKHWQVKDLELKKSAFVVIDEDSDKEKSSDD